jgi:single-strand DNA-binding protein
MAGSAVSQNEKEPSMANYKPGDTVALVGHVSKPSQLRRPGDGTPVIDFGIAVHELVDDGSGNLIRAVEPTWYKVTAWRQQALNVEKNLVRGTMAIVIGTFQGEKSREYEGKTFTDLAVTADHVGLSMRFGDFQVVNSRSADQGAGRSAVSDAGAAR